MEDFSNVKEPNDVTIFVADRLLNRYKFVTIPMEKGISDQMSKMLGHHKLQGLGCTGRIPSNHRITRHYLTDGCVMGIQSFSSDLRTKRHNTKVSMYAKGLKKGLSRTL